MIRKVLALGLGLIILISGLVGCTPPDNNEEPNQPGTFMFQPIALDTNPPYPMLYHIPFHMGMTEVGLIVNEKWETIKQLSPSESCWYVYNRDAERGTEDYVRFLCVSEVLNENYEKKFTVYDMAGNPVPALSDLGLSYEAEIIDNHLVVGEWGSQGIFDLGTQQLSLHTTHEIIYLLGPNLALVSNSSGQTDITDFSGNVIFADIENAQYVEGVLMVEMENGMGIMSLSGQWIAPPVYYIGGYRSQYFCNGYVAAIRNEDNMLVFINKNGTVEESAFGIMQGDYTNCETFKDFFVIRSDNQITMIDKDRVTTRELREYDTIFYADRIYFLARDNAITLFTFGGDLNFVEGIYADYAEIVQRGSDTYVIFLFVDGSSNSVCKIENGKLIECTDPMLPTLWFAVDQRFFIVSNGTAVGLVDYDGNWVFKTYKFYYLDDAYAEVEWPDWW